MCVTWPQVHESLTHNGGPTITFAQSILECFCNDPTMPFATQLQLYHECVIWPQVRESLTRNGPFQRVWAVSLEP